MRVLRRVDEGEVLPRGYRRVWLAPESVWKYGHTYVCAPVGLHWPLRWGYRLWALTFRFRPTALERKLAGAWEAGRRDAFAGVERAAKVKAQRMLWEHLAAKAEGEAC
jgi:hypothetical protein